MRGRSQRSTGARLSRLIRRGRELPALGLACIWIFGVVLAPVLHLAMHGELAPHAHAAALDDRAPTTGDESCHEDHCHDARAASEAGPHDDEAPADHGRGSQLHGDLAALFPSPALVIPPFVAIGERAQPVALGDVVDALTPPPSLARGPPTTT